MKFLRAICLALALLCYENSNALSVVRDAEIEEILTEFAQSLFKVAKLDPKTAKVYVIDSPEINAFTIGNGFIFINSGTLLRFSNPLEIFAILAHETAHIAAGHINRLIHVLQQRSENFSIAMLAGIFNRIQCPVSFPEELLILSLLSRRNSYSSHRYTQRDAHVITHMLFSSL